MVRESPDVDVAVADRQSALAFNEGRLADAVRRVMNAAGVGRAAVSVAVLGDEEMQELNARHLGHDGPTDALSFLLEPPPGRLEGEVVVNAEMAAREAQRYGGKAEDELLLYVVHAALHLVGYDDADPASAGEMRAAERRVLAEFDVEPYWAETQCVGRFAPAESAGPPSPMLSHKTRGQAPSG